ncbi:MAG: protein kinase [Kiritimatiellae bacterium]|nr:protein kinase [Kiritimatiellia bacterium]
MSEGSKKTMGAYEILDRISSGGQASVFKARDTRDGRLVALKVLRQTGTDETADMRFERESDLLRQLKHPNIVQYRDSFIAEGAFGEPQKCLAMELLQGETLKERLRRYPDGLDWIEASAILRQCLEGLMFAHKQHGVTHRDIKPSNIFLTGTGEAKLVDFGIARREGTETATGGASLLGSFDYMAPDFATIDRFRGDAVSDLFALTVCFYESVTGTLPFAKLGEMPELEFINRWRGDGRPAVPKTPPIFRVVNGLAAFMDRGMNPDRGDRFQDFGEMLTALGGLTCLTVQHEGADDYELIGTLGRGGFGEIYKGRRLRDGRVVAIKRLFIEEQSSRFVREAEILRKYRHPHIVEYIDFFEASLEPGAKHLFIVMDFLEGMPGWSLLNRVKASKRGLPVLEVIDLFLAYLDALQYLHEGGHQIIHRDIKPSNLYAPEDSPTRAKILDLGTARDAAGTKTTGFVPGTLDYMAPEFGTKKSFRGSPQSDLYSLGLCLYEALTRRLVWPRLTGSDQEIAVEFYARASGEKVYDVDFGFPAFRQCPALVDVVKRAIVREPAERFESAGEMRRALLAARKDVSEVLAGDGDLAEAELPTRVMAGAGVVTPALPPEELEKAARPTELPGFLGGRRRHAAIAAGILVVLLGVAGVSVWNVRSERRNAGREPGPAPAGAGSAGQGQVVDVPSPAGGDAAAGSGGAGGTQAGSVETPAPPSDPAGEGGDSATRAPGEPAGGGEPESQVTPAVVTPPPTEPATEPDPRPERVETPPPRTPARNDRPVRLAKVEPVTPPPVRPEPTRDDKLEGLLKELQLPQVMTLPKSTAREAAYNAAQRAKIIAEILDRSRDLADDPAVLKMRKSFWQFVARDLIEGYLYTKDARLLSVARGAILGVWPLYDEEQAADRVAAILTDWSATDRNIDFYEYLPLRRYERFVLQTDEAGRPRNAPFLTDLFARSRRVARIFPHLCSLSIQAGAEASHLQHKTRLDFVLVPDGKTEIGEIRRPFYMCKREVTLGAMRCYREGAGRETEAQSALTNYFTGSLKYRLPITDNELPVTRVLPEEAMEFCNWLSYHHGLQFVYERAGDGRWTVDMSKEGYRLASAREWQHAARFGFDWEPAPGAKPWTALREQIDPAQSGALVWFYYKKGPRASPIAEPSPYPLGVYDMCGNAGELCMQDTAESLGDKVPVTMIVCGGSYKSRSLSEVMPWSQKPYNESDTDVGFRVILPVTVERLGE